MINTKRRKKSSSNNNNNNKNNNTSIVPILGLHRDLGINFKSHSLPRICLQSWLVRERFFAKFKQRNSVFSVISFITVAASIVVSFQCNAIGACAFVPSARGQQAKMAASAVVDATGRLVFRRSLKIVKSSLSAVLVGIHAIVLFLV